MKRTMRIEGMMCGHCSGRVKKALEAVAGVETAEVSHETGMAAVTLNGHVSEAVTDAGYKVAGIE